MEFKVCKKCSLTKLISDFNKTGEWLRGECKTCQAEIKKQWYGKNKQHVLDYKKAYEKENGNSIKTSKQDYNQKNAEAISAYNKKRYYENQQYNIDRVTKYTTERLKVDHIYRLKFNIRGRIQSAFRTRGLVKRNSVITALGCTPNELKIHLENQFDGKMNWDNYGKYWHVDHIIPLAAFDLTDGEQFNKVCHFTNLQPLEAKENLKKRDKILTL